MSKTANLIPEGAQAAHLFIYPKGTSMDHPDAREILILATNSPSLRESNHILLLYPSHVVNKLKAYVYNSFEEMTEQVDGLLYELDHHPDGDEYSFFPEAPGKEKD